MAFLFLSTNTTWHWGSSAAMPRPTCPLPEQKSTKVSPSLTKPPCPKIDLNRVVRIKAPALGTHLMTAQIADSMFDSCWRFLVNRFSGRPPSNGSPPAGNRSHLAKPLSHSTLYPAGNLTLQCQCILGRTRGLPHTAESAMPSGTFSSPHHAIASWLLYTDAPFWWFGEPPCGKPEPFYFIHYF